MSVADTLLAFSRKEVGPPQVMRALCEYTGFLAPAGFALAATRTNRFDQMALFGQEARTPPGSLLLFTDRAAADVAAQKAQLGPYVSPVLGSLLFRALPAGFKEVSINPGLPREQGWWMADDALQLAQLWGSAIALEQALSGSRKDAALVEELLDFPGFIAFDNAQGNIVTAVGAAGLRNPALLFTAIDCAEVARARLGPQGSALKQVAISGARLFLAFASFGIDGFLVNPFGPGPVKVLDAELCRSLAELARARVKTSDEA